MKYAIHHHQFVNAFHAKKGINYICPFCHRRVIVHQKDTTRRAFFVHVNKRDQFYNPAETYEHLRGKHQLFDFFNASIKNVKIEQYLPQINQWPDLMFHHTAIEFQCSPISIKRLKERINGYSKLGIKSWWILGHPYYQRHFRSTYLARFINYSCHLGFFILFWLVKSNCLEIHYRIREQSGHLIFQARRIYKYQELCSFISTSYIHKPVLTKYKFKRNIYSEVSLNQKRMFHGDLQLVTLQSQINPFHNSLMGCPIICHWPVYTFPIFKQKALLWRIWILILLTDARNLNEVYQKVNSKLNLPLILCQIEDGAVFYRIAFNMYIRKLCQLHYLKLACDGKKITRFTEPRWFNSCYDKYTFLNKKL